MAAETQHVIYFDQMRDGKERSVALILREAMKWPVISAEGKWHQGKVLNYTGDDVYLYKNAPVAEKETLAWRWTSDTFEIEVGRWNAQASHKKGEERYFKPWFILFNARRYADWRFYTSSLTSPAKYVDGGSSDGFTNALPATWQLIPYNR